MALKANSIYNTNYRTNYLVGISYICLFLYNTVVITFCLSRIEWYQYLLGSTETYHYQPLGSTPFNYERMVKELYTI